MNIKDIKTFRDLYLYLQNNNNNIDAILNSKWKDIKYEPQESLFRLFSFLGLFDKLKGFCKGTINNNNFSLISSFLDIEDFLNEKCKDSGNISDATFLFDNTLTLTTSKNYEEYDGKINHMDFGVLKSLLQEHSKLYKTRLNIVVNNKSKFIKAYENIHESSNYLLKDVDYTIYDWDDLKNSYEKFKNIYIDIPPEKIGEIVLCKKKKFMSLKFGQVVVVENTLKLLSQGIKSILWGQLPRFGKSYCMANLCHQLSRNKQQSNFLIITLVPLIRNQYTSILSEYQEFEKFKIHDITNINYQKPTSNHNIFIVSKQLLTYTKNNKTFIKKKTPRIKWLSEMEFDLRFIDEVHYGGTSILSRMMIDLYSPKSPVVHITATFSKPVFTYNIPKEHQIIFDMEDVVLCKNMNETNKQRFNEKHLTFDVFNNFSFNTIQDQYSIFPNLHVLHWNFMGAVKQQLLQFLEKEKDTDSGFSVKSLFLMKGNKFQDEDMMREFCWCLFGRKNNDNEGLFQTEDKEYSNNILKSVKDICNLENSRWFSKENPLSILVFLPHLNIDKISNAWKKFLESNHIIDDFDIICVNSKLTKGNALETARSKCIGKKRGLLILNNRQCSLGITIKHCDVCFLFNNIEAIDSTVQSMFRCISDDIGKKCGVVVDCNIQRIGSFFMDFASKLNLKGRTIGQSLQYILEQKLVNLNMGKWNTHYFENKEMDVITFSDHLYKIWGKSPKFIIDTLKNVVHDVNDKIRDDVISMLKFTKEKNVKTIDENIEIASKMLRQAPEIKEGIITECKEIKDKCDNEDDRDKKIAKDYNEEEKKKDGKKWSEIFEYLVPVVCFITCEYNIYTYEEMFDTILKDNELYEIIQDKIKGMWENADDKFFVKISKIYVDYIRKNEGISDIIRLVKNSFIEAIDSNSFEFVKSVDLFLKPTEYERKRNAEISTPYVLRQEMLSVVPIDFWKTPKKVFEPCCGKIGFVYDVYCKFLEGLKDVIPDEEERKRVIFEECIYFSDINKMNVLSVKRIIDRKNKYKLNYYIGDTLKLDIKEKWGIKGFDLVIGNPPYQNRNNNKGTGNTLWDKFVVRSINIWLIQSGLFLFVHPRGWRQIGNKTGILMRQKQIIYLNMNDLKQGIKIFGCSTDYDYYLLENIKCYKETIIVDYNKNKYNYTLYNLPFVPNYNIDEIYKMIDCVKDNGFICDKTIYETRKKWMSKTKTENNIYPCVYSINSKNIVSERWSSRNDKGHFGIVKFIFSNGQGYLKDYKGEYGLTEWAYAFKCKIEEMETIEKSFKSKKFNDMINAIKLTSNKYNYNILKLFKKDFYKDFI